LPLILTCHRIRVCEHTAMFACIWKESRDFHTVFLGLFLRIYHFVKWAQQSRPLRAWEQCWSIMSEEGECFPCRFHYSILRPIFLDLRWIAIMVTATFEMPIMRPQPRPFLYCSIMQSYENASDPKRPTLCCIAKSTLAHLLNRADFPTFGRPTSMTFDSSSVDGCRSRCKAFFPDVPMLAVFFVVLSKA
jgi:hypothetical protein